MVLLWQFSFFRKLPTHAGTGTFSFQCSLNTFEITLHKESTCAMLAQSAHTSFPRKAGFSLECLVACFLTRYNITKQSWLFLFNVGSGVHSWLVGQQWIGIDIDWKNGCYFLLLIIIHCLLTFSYKYCINVFSKLCLHQQSFHICIDL